MTDRERGTLLSVDEEAEGSSVLVDTAAAALLVPLKYDGDFRDDGGLAWIADASYVYTGITDVPELELDASNPLAVAVDAGSPVLSLSNLGYPEARWVGKVQVNPDDEEPVRAYIDTTDRAYFRLGDVDAGALVEIEPLGLNRYRVASRLYDPASFDGAHLDPGSIPEPVPVDPPATSPLPTLSGYAGGIFARIPTLPASQEIEWHVWDISTGDDTYVPTQADPDTLFVTSRSGVQPIEKLPNGAPLVEDTTYYVATWSKNDAGYAPAPSLAVGGEMDMSVVRDIIAVSIAAGGIVTGQIDVGFSSWSADDGLVFRDQNGVPYITLPADGVSPALIRAFVIATGITIEDNANLYGLAQVFGIMKLTNGIPDPAIKAQMARGWDSVTSNMDDQFGVIWHGMCPKIGDATSFVTVTSFFGGSVRYINKTTGVIDPFVFPNLGSTWHPEGGVTAVGSFYYMLGRDDNQGGDWYVRKYNTSWVLQSDFLFTAAANVTKRPAIGTDGTNLIIGRCTPSGDLRFSEFTTAGAGAGGAVLITGGQNYDVKSADRLTADFGATRIVLASQPGNVYVFNTSNVRQTTHEWPVANGSRVQGMYWDSTRFRSFDATGVIWLYAVGHVSTSTIFGGYAWTDEDTGAPTAARHETKVSTGQSFSWPARSKLIVTGQTAPDVAVTDPTKTDKANLLRIYVGASAATMRLQHGGGTNDSLPLGVTSLALENPDTGSAIGLTTSTFIGIAGAMGSFESAKIAADGSPTAYVHGDGTARAMKSYQSGSFGFTALSANVVKTQAITFAEPFDVVPTVIGVQQSGDPTTFQVWAESVTTTGFTLNGRRVTGTANFTGRWYAVAPTQ